MIKPYSIAFGLILATGILSAGLCSILTGCATNGGSTPTGSQLIEDNLPLIRTGASIATGATLNFAVTDPAKRTKLANEMYTAAAAIYSLTGTGTFPTVAQLQNAVIVFGGTQADASYAQFSTAIASLYSSYYPKINTGDVKTATDLLNAIAGGIEDATASYVTTPAPTTMVLPLPRAPVVGSIRPPLGERDPYHVLLARK